MTVIWRAFAAVLIAVASLSRAQTDQGSPPVPSASPPPIQTIVAHPALWTVKGKAGTVYLLGSLHLLPPELDWKSPEIAHAIQSADVFVFEIPDDSTTQQKVKELIADDGSLAKGESLRAMLPRHLRTVYDADLAQTKISPEVVDGKRPWLVSLVLEVARLQQENASMDAGVDHVLMKEAEAEHKETRYLETVEQQMALIVPRDPALELQEFEADLKEFHDERDDYPEFVSAWSTGDVRRIDQLMNGSLADYPSARKVLLDDRNHAWVKELEAMLAENKTFLVTVGAGHLAGPGGVPALLKANGYEVQGP